MSQIKKVVNQNKNINQIYQVLINHKHIQYFWQLLFYLLLKSMCECQLLVNLKLFLDSILASICCCLSLLSFNFKFSPVSELQAVWISYIETLACLRSFVLREMTSLARVAMSSLCPSGSIFLFWPRFIDSLCL